MTSGYYAPRWTSIDRNLYWNTQGEDTVRFNDWSSRILKDVSKVEDVSFAQWQELGRDQNSVVVDPGFADPGAGDFQLGQNSPAAATGFESFDIDQTGLYGEPEWTALPKQIQREPLEYSPPPLSGFPLDYGFEQYESGEMPIVTGRMMESGNLGTSDRETKTILDVPFASDQFTTCTWFGISSLDNNKAIYYLDNVRMTINE